MAKACFSMTPQEKALFCKVLKEAKLPQGCASNIVQAGDKKVSGYMSHDAHFMMHYLLKIAVRTLPRNVAIALTKLGDFFRGICSKVVKLQDLEQLQLEIVETICLLEMNFPPCFF